ncbi:MAG TPA: hypothetical protein VHB46_11650 [Burkholderiales bacterium]|nr:hypothetical protein [Burkholderiales bacterium]
MFAAVPHRMFPWAERELMGQKLSAGNEPAAHAELWGGLERDLERLQILLDGATEELSRSFCAMSDTLAGIAPDEDARKRVRVEADRVVTCLQFHDVASQIISNLRGRAELLEMAALAATPDSMVDARSRLLADALRLTKSRPDIDFDKKSGDVDLF